MLYHIISWAVKETMNIIEIRQKTNEYTNQAEENMKLPNNLLLLKDHITSKL